MNKNKRNLCILCLCVMLFCILFKLYSGNNLLVERYVENFDLGEGDTTTVSPVIVSPVSPVPPVVNPNTNELLTENEINQILKTNSGDIDDTNLIPNLRLTMPTVIGASYLEESTLANNIIDTSITNDFITTAFSDIDIRKIKTQYDDDDESALKNDSYLKEVDTNINTQITYIEGIIDNNNQKINSLITTLNNDIERHHTKLNNIARNNNYIRDVINGSITICNDIQDLKSFKDFKENENIDNKINNLNKYNNFLESITLDLSSITQHKIDISGINSQIETVVEHINNHLNALHHNHDNNHCTYDSVEDASKLSAIKCKLTDLKETNDTIKNDTINDYFSTFNTNLNTDNITFIEVTDLEVCQTKLSECNTLYDNINNMLRTNIAMRESAAYPGGISDIVEQHCFNLNESEGCTEYLNSINHGPGCVVQCSVKDDQGNCLVVNEDSVNIYASLEGGTPTRIHTHPHKHGGDGWGGGELSEGILTESESIGAIGEGTISFEYDDSKGEGLINTTFATIESFVGTHKIEPFVGSMYATF